MTDFKALLRAQSDGGVEFAARPAVPMGGRDARARAQLHADNDIGDIDLLGEIAGGGYDALLPASVRIQVFGVEVRCLSLEQLIDVKRARRISGRSPSWRRSGRSGSGAAARSAWGASGLAQQSVDRLAVRGIHGGEVDVGEPSSVAATSGET